MVAPAQSTGNWSDLGAELWFRIRTPFNNSIFIFYFVFFVILFGGLGVWMPFLPLAPAHRTPNDSWALANNLATYFVALTGATFADAHLRKGASSRVFDFFLLIIFVSSLLLGLCSLAASSCLFALRTAVVGTVVSLIAWWIANATNPSLKDETPTDAPTGGDVQKSLKGDFKGLEV